MTLRGVTFLLLLLMSVLGCANAEYSHPAMKVAATEAMAVTGSSGSIVMAPPLPTEAAIERKEGRMRVLKDLTSLIPTLWPA